MEKRPAEASRFFLNSVGLVQLVAINNHLVVVSISVMVAILYNNVPIPMFVTITKLGGLRSRSAIGSD
jgi:hypothetical protein